MSARSSRWPLPGLMLAALLGLGGCSSPAPHTGGTYKLGDPYQVGGQWYYPQYDPGYDRTGVASWYGAQFHGKATANGEVFDRNALSAAHPTLPLPSVVRVTNLVNHRQLELRVNDRGPFVDGRIIDLSQRAARALGFEQQGTTPVRVQFLHLAGARDAPPQPPAQAPVVAQAPVSVQPVAQAPVAIEETPQCAGRFIQIGAFAEPERAARLARRLNARSVAAADHYTRVRIGPIGDAAAAAAALDQIKRNGYPGAFMVPAGAGDGSIC